MFSVPVAAHSLVIWTVMPRIVACGGVDSRSSLPSGTGWAMLHTRYRGWSGNLLVKYRGLLAWSSASKASGVGRAVCPRG